MGGLSVSIGVAVLGTSAATVQDILEQADRCLYAAKRAGRDRVAFQGSGHSLDNVA